MRSLKITNRCDKYGRRVGLWEVYYDNGNLESNGFYINGLCEGVFNYYHSN